MTTQDASRSYRHSGFFVIRTPLLPFHILTDLCPGPSLSSEASYEADRQLVRSRLRALMARPEIREAMLVASPSLDQHVDKWLNEPDTPRGLKVERSLIRYLYRMAGRATPFGLFAGCSLGSIAAETDLRVCGTSGYSRHSRLDMDLVFALTESLGRDPAVRDTMRYWPNSGLYKLAGQWHYVRSKLQNGARSYHLIEVEADEALEAVLARAGRGATTAELSATLVHLIDDLSVDEARDYLNELVDTQVIVSDFTPGLTGGEPLAGLVAQLEAAGVFPHVTQSLKAAAASLARLDQSGFGNTRADYEAIASGLRDLPTPIDSSRLVQVDMSGPSTAVLSEAIVDELLKSVEFLHAVTLTGPDPFAGFRDRFKERYERQEVPLCEALDEELGIGFEIGDPPTPTWTPFETVLLRKLEAARQTGATEILLDHSDLPPLRSPRPPLPAAFHVLACVSGVSSAAVRAGELEMLLHYAGGPSGGRMLGRFCHSLPGLTQHLEDHLRAEEALDADAIFAEVVHLPEGRLGNVICRPVLREYEIPYLGASGVAHSHQISVNDLTIQVWGDEIVLRSRRLDRRITPRMTTAHSFSNKKNLTIYRFLCGLQSSRLTSGVAFSWGHLENSTHLPRVRVGRTIVSLAKWRISRLELKAAFDAKGAALFAAVQELRRLRRLPRFVEIADGDNKLPIDLNNVLSVDSMIALLRKRSEGRLTEMFPEPQRLCASGPEGSFVHEIVVPVTATTARPGRQQPVRHENAVRRVFPPGSEWLYIKLSTGISSGDRLLSDVAGPVIRSALKAGNADSWFFLRYADPEWHIRLRIHGDPVALAETVIPELHAAWRPWVEDGRLWRVQYDTYQREVERYGGPEGVLLAEQIFAIDSDWVLEILEFAQNSDNPVSRLQLAMLGIDALQNDFGLEAAARIRVLQGAETSTDNTAGSSAHHQLNDRFRQERKTIERVLGGGAEDTLGPAMAATRRRSHRMAPLVAALRSLEAAGNLAIAADLLIGHFIHMSVNRLSPSSSGVDLERLSCALLRRYHESALARARRERSRETT
jgi:thiopeptide-type bacteriocin biosynthesis protein